MDHEKLQKSNAKMQKHLETLENEKRSTHDEIDRLQREATNRESILRYICCLKSLQYQENIILFGKKIRECFAEMSLFHFQV